MILHRLLKNDPTSWRVFPDFVARVRAMALAFSPDLDPDVMVTAIETKFVETPALTYYLGVFEGAQMIGHLAAWIDVSYGKPYVFVAQAQMDEGHALDQLATQALDGLDQWAAALNDLYVREQSPHRLLYTEMWTPWPPELWERYLRKNGRSSRAVRHVIRWDVPLSERHMVQNPQNG